MHEAINNFLGNSMKIQLFNSKYDHLRVTKCRRRPMVNRGQPWSTELNQ